MGKVRGFYSAPGYLSFAHFIYFLSSLDSISYLIPIQVIFKPAVALVFPRTLFLYLFQLELYSSLNLLSHLSSTHSQSISTSLYQIPLSPGFTSRHFHNSYQCCPTLLTSGIQMVFNLCSPRPNSCLSIIGRSCELNLSLLANAVL